MRVRTLFALLTLSLPAAAAAPDWAEMAGPTQAKVPPPRLALDDPKSFLTFHKNTAESRVDWQADLLKGLSQAKAENRPVFVTMRCLPCKSCSDFDKGVLEGGPDLDPLLLRFVTVRLTSAKDVDMRMLPMETFQDLDTSWWGWFLSPEGKVYGVFGGRDASGDAGRTSKAALIAALKRVLDHHYDPRRPAWDIDGPSPVTAGAPKTPVDLPGFNNWLAKGRNEAHVKEQGCIHCHQVQEILHQTAIDAGKFDKTKDLDVWPLPENAGFSLERDDGLKINRVREDSPAAKAGLKVGDVLIGGIPAPVAASPAGGAASAALSVGPRRFFSQADVRAALHRLPTTGPAHVQLVYSRDGQIAKANLSLADGWRKGNSNWRISLSEGVVGAFPGFWANDGARFRKERNIPADSMAVVPFFPSGPKINDKDRGPAWAAGLRGNDVITAVNGQSPNLAARAWIIWFRLNHDAGQEIKLDVVDAK
ncbi:MAG: hypothetical protein ACAI43_20385, partial [Phycisphaerae bacterium]